MATAVAPSRDFNPGNPTPTAASAFPPFLLLIPFLAAILPAAILAVRGKFDGLYGQDPFIYYDYAVGPLRQSLSQLEVPPPSPPTRPCCASTRPMA